MSRRYRDWAERREIIRATIAATNHRPIGEFQLDEAEETYFRVQSERMVGRLARASSGVKGYYALPTARPFAYVVLVSILVAAIAFASAAYIVMHERTGEPPSPLLAACATVAVVAIGWSIAGWMTHRNTIRQNTNAILFARFSQAPFGEALHRFHSRFGWTLDEAVTSEMLGSMRTSGKEADARAVASVAYILNYFESIASGVLHGDLDRSIVGDNVRGFVCAYHDKCAPHVRSSNAANPRTYENLIRLRTHFREP